MNDKLKQLESRAQAVEDSVTWWEEKLSKTMDSYESARLSNDEKKMSALETELKTLLRRAEMEKMEMAKIETEINQACAEAAFKGRFSVSTRKKNNG
jgi:chromosome segregation ATPase